MDEIKTFRACGVDFEIGSFDIDKEIKFSISAHERTSTWLTANQVNELINHLADCLRSVNEPIELLTKQ